MTALKTTAVSYSCLITHCLTHFSLLSTLLQLTFLNTNIQNKILKPKEAISKTNQKNQQTKLNQNNKNTSPKTQNQNWNTSQLLCYSHVVLEGKAQASTNLIVSHFRRFLHLQGAHSHPRNSKRMIVQVFLCCHQEASYTVYIRLTAYFK